MMALKLVELTQFALPNLSILILSGVEDRCDSGRLSVHSAFIEKSIAGVLMQIHPMDTPTTNNKHIIPSTIMY